ncbi:CocE/NonD family hydrolase [Capillimicrobium parvum]|uniref:Cocaine esterase n=1 Tax=Capillimicrobium parvum TaxID=2884022 RepID=A0A9E6XY30_9ACTN|nr:CocE/NonD family hydrolase [Capillimicrobium parvum]UGS36602.1 Cocaine esterase [Capillimicrobium parvum]
MSLLSEILGRSLRLPAPQTRDVEVLRDLPATMDDGVVLLADRYVPAGAAGHEPPTVLVRTPYGRRGFFGVVYGRLLAERGFQVVVQSVRGTFGSGGRFAPFDERADGLATLRWLRGQPWCEGPVGMIGSSYMGLVQWAVAAEAGDELGALAPSITASQFHGQAFPGGSLALDTALSWTFIIAAQERRLFPLRLMFGLSRRLPKILDELPLGELDALVAGESLPFYREWFERTAPDEPYWRLRDYSPDVGRVTAPVQLIGGWYDIFLPWMIEDHVALRRAGHETQLIIGPWAHTSPGVLATSTRQGLAWLRAHLLDDRRLLRDAPVQLFVGGEGAWRSLETWPPPEARTLRLHLQPGGGLAADPPPPDGEPDHYRYDPAHPTPAIGGPVLLARQPVTDNRPLEAREDVIVFTSAPLADDLEAIGPVSAEIHFRSSLENTDVFVRICDVLPEGVSLNVCDALLRLSPGSPGAGPDGVRAVALDLWPTAHRFRAGHRIRVQVSSGAHPRYARNPGTGEAPATARTLVAAEQEVFHDAAHPSAVMLSVMPKDAQPAGDPPAAEAAEADAAAAAVSAVSGDPPTPRTAEDAAAAVSAVAVAGDPLDAELRDDARFEHRLLLREIAIVLFVAAVVVARSIAGFG